MTSSDLPPLPELAVRTVVVWRHGRTEWNVSGRFQGQLDPPLDEVGREEVVRSAPMLAAGLPRGATVVVSSDLQRAVDTGSALTDLLDVPLLREPRLREHGMGSWEGLTRAEVAEQFPDQYAAWISGQPVVDRGGEAPAAVGERALAALVDLPPADVAVVVTHGGTAGRLMERMLGLEPHQRRLFAPLTNCAWSELTVQGTRWRLQRHNVAAFPVAAHPAETARAPESDADAVA